MRRVLLDDSITVRSTRSCLWEHSHSYGAANVARLHAVGLPYTNKLQFFGAVVTPGLCASCLRYYTTYDFYYTPLFFLLLGIWDLLYFLSLIPLDN